MSSRASGFASRQKNLWGVALIVDDAFSWLLWQLDWILHYRRSQSCRNLQNLRKTCRPPKYGDGGVDRVFWRLFSGGALRGAALG
jgi:hypothetical protein